MLQKSFTYFVFASDKQRGFLTYNRGMTTKYAYFVVLAATIVVPLVLSLIPWRLRWSGVEWRRLAQVFLFVSVPFILLDTFSHSRGWWAYNPEFVTGIRVVGLPIEEVLFFFVVPFACLYLLSAFVRMNHNELPQRYWPWRIALGLFVAIAVVLAIFEPRERTLFDAALFILVAAMVSLNPPKHVEVLWLTAVVGLFLIVNTVLTALPIVVYDGMFGSRYLIGTIPIEDVLYNFSFLLLCLSVWRWQPARRLYQAVRRV